MKSLKSVYFTILRNFRRITKAESPIFYLSILIGITYILVFLKFILLFGHNGYSNNPGDWYNFIGMITGIVTLAITGLIAWQIQKINSKTTSKYAKLPYSIKAYDKYTVLTRLYYDRRDKIIGMNKDLLQITNEYVKDLAEYIYFECIYFDNEINQALNEYRIFMLKYIQWLESMKDIGLGQLNEFVFEHAVKTQEIDFLFAEITKKMKNYLRE